MKENLGVFFYLSGFFLRQLLQRKGGGGEFFAWNVHTKKVGSYDLIMILLFGCALCGISIGPKLNLNFIFGYDFVEFYIDFQ
jgi:hypothetical protein